jgi:hypothetical protein
MELDNRADHSSVFLHCNGQLHECASTWNSDLAWQ